MKIPRAQADAIAAHARSGYPHEICGVLVGTARDGVVRVARAVPVTNRETERPAVRYQIAPADLIEVQRSVREEGLQQCHIAGQNGGMHGGISGFGCIRIRALFKQKSREGSVTAMR